MEAKQTQSYLQENLLFPTSIKGKLALPVEAALHQGKKYNHLVLPFVLARDQDW